MAVDRAGRQLGESELSHAVELGAAYAAVLLEALHLEITESVLMDDSEGAADSRSAT